MPGGTIQAPGAGEVEGYLNLERWEAEGQRLMPEQMKTMLKVLARSSLLRRYPR